MRLIDTDTLDITTIETSDYDGNEVLDVILKEDIDDAPTIFELPNNPTNGDMIKAMFPITDIQPSFTNEPILIIDIEIGENIASAIRCTEEWWNAPYERS